MKSSRRKKLPPKVEDMTKEQVAEFVKKKRDCDAVAMSNVMALIESGISENFFLEKLPYINQTHYEDITEERALTKICGYPLCDQKLPEDLPSQKYKISVKTNRVYDITMRKNFCSNQCYKASVFVKDQILTSPLWYRDETDLYDFKLLELSEKQCLVGDQVDFSSTASRVKIDDAKDSNFKSFLDFTQASLDEISQDGDKDIQLEIEKEENNKMAKIDEESVNQINNAMENVTINDSQTVNEENVEGHVNKENKTEVTSDAKIEPETKIIETKKAAKKVSKSGILGEVFERKPSVKVDPILTAGEELPGIKKNKSNKLKKNEKQPILAAIIHIEKCISEWFCLDTMIYLFGVAKVKEMVDDKGECIKEYLNNQACGLFYKSTSYDQYQELCRKLNLLELEDKRYDSKVMCNKTTKPLPHYSILQKEGELLDLKVKAFYKGQIEIPIKEKVIQELEEDEASELVMRNLPMVDKKAQNALRRNIVLNGLTKVLPDLAQALGISSREIMGNIRLLVATFNLQAHNIMFKPGQWNLIAIIMIKLLSMRDGNLASSLSADVAVRHLMLLLMSYEQDGGYLERLVLWLTDIDRLLDSSDTQLSVDKEMLKL